VKAPVFAIGALALTAVAILLLTGDEDSAEDAAAHPLGGELLGVLQGTKPPPDLDLIPDPPENLPGPEFPIARVQEGDEVELRDSPGGELISRLGDQTELGSQRTFWIERIQGDWFGVHAPELPNDRLGWIRDDRSELDLVESRYWIVADTSARVLELRYGRRVLERFPVTVGSPGSPTPLGSYAVTDGLAGPGVIGAYYGCCVLALTGHQPNLPANWIGGDRIAIHGTPGATGGADSSGCLRASNADMVSLFARAPLGTPVFIRA
jgi:hypothetical protein